MSYVVGDDTISFTEHNIKECTDDCKTCGKECEYRAEPCNSEAIIKKIAILEPRQRDEIDEWLEKECNIYSCCCSSIETLKYNTARLVAEKLWKKGEL